MANGGLDIGKRWPFGRSNRVTSRPDYGTFSAFLPLWKTQQFMEGWPRMRRLTFALVLISCGLLVACGGGGTGSGTGTTTGGTTGGSGGTPAITLSTNSLDFGSVNIGSSSTLPVTVTNSGTADLHVTTLNITGTNANEFSSSGATLPLTLTPGNSVTLNVTFTPTVVGTANATVSGTSDAATTPTISLTGIGVGVPQISTSPVTTGGTLDFGSVSVGASRSLDLTVSNPGTATLTGTIGVAGAGFALSGTTVLSVAPGNNQIVTVIFTPSSATTFNGSLTITHNATGGTANFVLTGAGVNSALNASPNPLPIGGVKVGKSSGAQSVTITNISSSPVTISAANITGSGLSVGGLALPVTLAAGQNTSLNVTFVPGTFGVVNGTLNIVSDDPASPLTVGITANGLPSTFFISPSGSDTNDGFSSQAQAVKSFAKVFSLMGPGDELVVLDGTYSVAAGTGIINALEGAPSGAPPNGTSTTDMTRIHALNEGSVFIDSVDNFNLFLGRSFFKQSFVKIQGVTFRGAGNELYNTSFIVLKNDGFTSTTNGSNGQILGTGTNDGDWGNSFILMEDIWVWGQERIGLITFRSDHVVIRRAVVRNDGCATARTSPTGCASNSGNFMVGTTAYLSDHISWQNVIVLDDVLGTGYNGASDFSTAMHFSANDASGVMHIRHPFGAIEWLGSISLNTEYTGFRPESDNAISLPTVIVQPAYTFKDVVAWGSSNLDQASINVDVSGGCSGGCNPFDLNMENVTVNHGAANPTTPPDAIRIGPNMSASTNSFIRNIAVTGTARFGVNSIFQPTFADVGGLFTSGNYNQTTCSGTCLTINPVAAGAIVYPTRIESVAGNPLKGTGFNGSDIGANIRFRYGTDGTFYGDAAFNTLGTVSLWPLPNEARIKKEMCTDVGIVRGMCAKTGVTEYVWTFTGALVPGTF